MIKINANGKEITLLTSNTDYISLTDIARYANPEEPKDVVKNWLRNRNTIEFLGTWERIHNPNFKGVEFDSFKSQSGLNGFTLSPQKWIAQTAAIGIISKSGRGGGTYAHSDIAFEFASWISPEFKLYIIQDYQRLKQEEDYKNQIEWQANRYIAKLNHTIHTDAIKENIIPTLTQSQIRYAYASEMDLINVALYGMTAKEYSEKYPDKEGNLRDNSTIEQLLILNNLQNLNAEMIKQGIERQVRLEQLNRIAIQQLKTLTNSNQKALKELKKLID
ncbi:KilA-N domain-containing protein [Streptococcus cuniculipharyngis]|uniref:KilA-N domain-containing protein n=1 Tax=Streptococcus cuniculipharyngis TaxID=1562651 RepID=A0A5C5SGA3_9STRE|nr:KilA-N domain-containing protein [Streptococcus cuniculipharyngis]TWS99173.1 KilA-N domain-containing protein [Streptococcus cuniculipharyngis]